VWHKPIQAEFTCRRDLVTGYMPQLSASTMRPRSCEHSSGAQRILDLIAEYDAPGRQPAQRHAPRPDWRADGWNLKHRIKSLITICRAESISSWTRFRRENAGVALAGRFSRVPTF